jgi:hypothetical protein
VKVKVNFFKPSGKWYSGGVVDVGDARPGLGNLYGAIVKNQQILKAGACQHYVVVVGDAEGEECQDFCAALYYPRQRDAADDVIGVIERDVQ